MKRNTLNTAITEAERFLERAKALAELDDHQATLRAARDAERAAGKTVWDWGPHTLEHGGRETGDVKRASMDLTRALADLRRRG